VFPPSAGPSRGPSRKLPLVRRLPLLILLAPLLVLFVACGYPNPYAANQGGQSGVGASTPQATASPSGDPFSMGQNAKLVHLPNGLAYANIKVGTGALAQANDTATMDYTLYSASGEFLQTSIGSSNGPFTTELSSSALIPGFVQGVEGMRVGGIRRVVVPQDLGYGQTPPSGIPAGTLVFIVRLKAISAASPSPSPSPS
jgi:FKBP-type peptidyl-prolyl cis-trans isomerase FkpA